MWIDKWYAFYYENRKRCLNRVESNFVAPIPMPCITFTVLALKPMPTLLPRVRKIFFYYRQVVINFNMMIVVQ